jgi:cytochrome P450
VQTLFRTALADVTLGDTAVPAGTKVMALLGAANRDPAQFPDPDRLDLTRTGSRHFSFSQGTHFCLGARLARLQTTIALRCLMERTGTVELAGQPRWKPNFSLHSLESLPVTLAAA